MGWQWHQLDHMQIICTSLQTDNHASTSPIMQLIFHDPCISVLCMTFHQILHLTLNYLQFPDFPGFQGFAVKCIYSSTTHNRNGKKSLTFSDKLQFSDMNCTFSMQTVEEQICFYATNAEWFMSQCVSNWNYLLNRRCHSERHPAYTGASQY